MKKNSFNEDISENFEEAPKVEFGKSSVHHPDVLTTDEILNPNEDSVGENSAFKSLYAKMTSNAKQTEEDMPEKSLLDKCMPYILDEDGNDTSVNTEPLYKLESVAEILRADSQRTLEKLTKEYGIVFDDVPKESVPQKPIEEEPVEEEPISVISDIDIPDSPFYKIDSEATVSDETVTFTPITDKGDVNSKILVSTHTRPIDFTGELLKINEPTQSEPEEVRLEKSEFEEFKPQNEYEDAESGKKLLKRLARDKKNGFLAMWGSILLTLLTAIFRLPIMSDLILSYTATTMIITSAFVLLTVVLNFKIFTGLVKCFTKFSGADTIVSLAIIATGVYSVFGIINKEIILDSQLLLMLILCFSAVSRFLKASAMLRSFKQIYTPSTKQGIALLSDPAVTLAITKGAVEGDCLIAAPQSTGHIEDFMKHSQFGLFLNGRVNIITVVSLVLSVLTGVLAAVFYNGAVYGFYTASAIMCLTALPTLMLVDALPFYHSAKKLAKSGGMLAGKTGAELVEQANAVVLSSKDLFPSGTVTLHQMQVLSQNDLQDTIIRAASLTEAMQSPLSPIFKKIAGTSNITVFPDSDTVKYEEAMGISGWVDNRLLFIGNRTLLEAHGIKVPDIETDRRILRQGFFPVYVADQSKACALLVVRYDADADISRELRHLTGSGVTLLIKSSDPNLTEEMLCDYLGLYEDSVKLMTAAGCHLYVNSVTLQETLSAPAAFKTNPLGLPLILNCAGRMKRSNIILTAAYIISAVFGVLIFAYASFGGSGSLLSDTAILIYTLISTVITYLLYLTQKP